MEVTSPSPEQAVVKVVLVTTGLESGGAEMILYQLVTQIDRTRFLPVVVSLTNDGPILGKRIRDAGIELHCLGYKRGAADPSMVIRLAILLRSLRPDVVQTWMYHADLVGGLATRMSLQVPLSWSVFSVFMDKKTTSRSTIAVMRCNAWLSRFVPDAVACCSQATTDFHEEFGYDRSKLRTIALGVDTDAFVPNTEARKSFRTELGLDPSVPLIGISARFDPQKDHETFFRAAGQFYKVNPNAHYVVFGAGTDSGNTILNGWAKEAGVGDVTHLLGLRDDVARVTAALDVATCCSRYGESFALVLAEAMSSEVQVVTTDMAGPVSVVDKFGDVIPVGDTNALTQSWQRSLDRTPSEISYRVRHGREHIIENFSIMKVVQKYESLFTELHASRK